MLAGVRRSLDAWAFSEAFLTMRRNRINLNLIHDHNPEVCLHGYHDNFTAMCPLHVTQVFFEHVKEFVCGLDTPANINLFLTELR